MKSIKSFSVLFAMLLMVFMISGCAERINPGYTGIKVVYGGGDRGVQDFPIQTGWVFYMPGMSTVFEFPTFVKTAAWTRDNTEGSETNEEISFNTKEGMVVSGDISLSYQLIDKYVPSFYVKFRTEDLDVFTHGFLRNVARDAFNEIGSRYNLEDVYGPQKEKFMKEVTAYVNAKVNPYGVVIEQFGFIGAMRIPPTVKAALDMKIQATQDAIRVENEVRQAKAEAQKKIATAEGVARSNELIRSSVTPTLIEWEKLQIQKLTVWKWNGVRPYYEGANAGLMFSQK